MSAFRTGPFDRSRLRVFRKLCPCQAYESIADIDVAELARQGKKLLLLDADNTILPWKGEQVPPEVAAWIASAKEAGLQLCILSNTRRPARLARIAASLQVDYIRDKFKPSRRMYLMALARYGASKEEAVMIGDQIFTDVLGANRAGIDAIWVKPIARKEFAGTKISRLGERLVCFRIYRAMGARKANPR